MIVISNGKTTIVGATISNISNIPNLTQGSVQSGEYLPLSFEYSDYNGNYDDAEFIATFTSASGVTYKHPFYYDGTGTTYRANTRFPDGGYTMSLQLDGTSIPINNNLVDYNQGWSMDDFIRDHGTEPQLALKGGEPFYPAGFNGQYGLNLLDPDDASFVDDSEENFDINEYVDLLASMSMYPNEWNYLRFNFSNDLHLLNNTNPSGIPGTIDRSAANAINLLMNRCEEYGMNEWNVFFHRGGLNQMLLTWDGAPSAFTEEQLEAWNTNWSASIWYSDNGGPLDHPRDLIYNDTATGYFKNALRYSIARWGYRTSWMVRELCAEVYLWGHNYDELLENGRDDLVSWYEGLKNYMNSIDPYGQWISTGDGGTGPAQHDGANMDLTNSHLHHNPPGKSKVISISPYGETTDNLYAVYNHYTHLQSNYVNLSTQKYINGSLGNGPWISDNVSGASDKSSDLFGITRALHDRHAYWENAFSAACGVGCSWDIDGHLAKFNTPALNYSSIRFAKSASFHTEVHTPINNVGIISESIDARGYYYALGMQNSNRTAVYLFDIQSGSSDIGSGYYLTASSECPIRSGVTASVPVSFDGNFDARVFNVDTAVEGNTITGTVTNSTASVYLPNFQRAIALIVTSSST